ncbi:MAG: VanZ family protein [Steroidobacter sp.]
MTHSRAVVFWLLLAVIALIAYGSLYPFNFKSDSIEGGVFNALSQLSWQRAGRGDRISNVLLYLPLGFCLFLWLATRFNRIVSALLATILAALLSLTIEVAQVYISSRVPSLTDLTLNTLGGLLGVAGGLVWRALSSLMHLPSRPEKPARDPGAALVIALWLIWRFAPFAPQFDLGKLKSALQPLFNPHFDAAAVFIYLTCWLVVNQAIAALVSRPRRLEALLIVIAAVLIGRLVVANQTLVPSELLALLLLLPLVVLMHRLTPRPRRAVLVFAVIAVLIIDELAPFDFTATGARFDLWPFVAWFDRGVVDALQTIAWVQLFGTLFLYGALIWVIREWGASTHLAIGATAAIALTIEVLQVWVPHERASITDPLLAAAIGLLLRSLYRRLRPRDFAGRANSRRVRSR